MTGRLLIVEDSPTQREKLRIAFDQKNSLTVNSQLLLGFL